MKGIADDWKAIRARGARSRAVPKAEAIEDLHEDWATLKGGYPPYAYIVRWELSTACCIYKIAIHGKGRTRHGVYFKGRYAGRVFKTPGFVSRLQDGIFDRSELCFTREEVERSLERQRILQVDHTYHAIRDLYHVADTLMERLKYMREQLDAMRQDPVPIHILEGLPRRSKVPSPRAILEAKANEAAAVARSETGVRNKPTRKEKAHAAKSPAYKIGDRVLVYVDDEPGTILCPDPRFPGHWFVLMDRPKPENRRGWESVSWDNINKPERATSCASPSSRTKKS